VAPRPPPGFAARPLLLGMPPAGAKWLRLYPRRHGNPLGHGKAPSRFSDPRPLAPHDRYGVVYFGSSLKACILEAIVRDWGDARLGDLIIARRELEDTVCAEIEPLTSLQLVDLTGDGPVRMGVPSDAVRAADQSLGQQWGLAFWEHDAKPDGILYPSRLNNEPNVAIFDRALPKLLVTGVGPLLDRRAELAVVIRTLGLAIL
jgi:hypothetical protein